LELINKPTCITYVREMLRCQHPDKIALQRYSVTIANLTRAILQSRPN